MPIVGRALALAATFSLLTPGTPSAWGLRTHLWIAQQVLNDTQDGSLNIAGRTYVVQPEMVEALRTYPDRYRSGALGPDVFPDPIVGQTTFHPGVAGGWQTDDWLYHLLGEGSTPEEIAFAYGFTAHISGDIFAHTYVNAYAGDVFFLSDERTVELRHFSLEKYIEALTPELRNVDGSPVAWDDVAPASAFARDAFILDGDAAQENLRAVTGTHLAAMYGLHQTLGEIDSATRDITSQIAEWVSEYLLALGPANLTLDQAKLALNATEVALNAQEVLLNAKREAYELALGALEEARGILDRNPGLITFNERRLAEQITRAADLAADAARIASEVVQEIDGLQGRLGDLRGKIAGLACHLLIWPDAVEECQERAGDLNNQISNIEAAISGAQARREAAEALAREAANLRDSIRDTIARLEAELDEATRNLNNNIYQAAVDVAEADLQLQEQVLEGAREAVRFAQEKVDDLQQEVDRLNVFKDEAEELINRFNVVSLFLRNWQNDIEVAAEEYIKASHRAGVLLVLASDNTVAEGPGWLECQANPGLCADVNRPLDEYQNWLECYGPVFVGVPRQVSEAGCFVTGGIEELRAEYDKAMAELPEFLRWVLNPAGEVMRLAERELRDEFDSAVEDFLTFLTDEETAAFLILLSDPRSADRENLNAVFRSDESGKGLLVFDDVASMIDDDLGLNGGRLSPEAFFPLQHSVTLAKLSLLSPPELNRLASDLSGSTGSPLYGEVIYPDRTGHFSLLLSAVRSIDGNHQWQAYGLPWPRRVVQDPSPAGDRAFGRDYFLNAEHGFRFWVDPYLRERVFYQLFPGSAHGILARSSAMAWPTYRFPECAQNPFPSVQGADGRARDSDRTCVDVSDPEAPLGLSTFANREEYAEVHFACGERPLGGAWTVAGSFLSEAGARRGVEEIQAGFPDLAVEVWQPRPPNRYWTVMAASCVSEEVAEGARNLLLRRGIASDAFLWSPRLPWSPVTSYESESWLGKSEQGR